MIKSHPKCKGCSGPVERRPKEKPGEFRDRMFCSHACYLRSCASPALTKTCEWCGATFHRDNRSTYRYWRVAKFCSSGCSGQAQSAKADASRISRAETFAKWVDKTGDCWLWTGARDKNGYGAFGYAGKMKRAHVAALEIDGREVPKGMYVCHHCDNPPCVNPSHLYVGTPAQNMADAKARGRLKLGERHYGAKLRDADIVFIRSSSATNNELAEKYSVTNGAIHAVRRRKTWKHVP